MKRYILLGLIIIVGGYTSLFSQTACTNEKGFYDFPFTENGLTVTGSGTGSYQSYDPGWGSCGIFCKPYCVWIGSGGPATFTNTFSQPVNDMVYNITASDPGEIITITTNLGTTSITYTDGTCPAGMSISGNVITCVSSNAGGRFLVHASSNFTSVTFSHNGGMNGSTMTMCFDAVFESLGPTVTTAAISSITDNSAMSGGDVTNDGGATVTVRGVCWNTTGAPTTADDYTTDGTGLGTFTSSLTGLIPGTTYHVRAYATNSVGTGYGEELIFTTTGAANVPISNWALALMVGLIVIFTVIRFRRMN